MHTQKKFYKLHNHCTLMRYYRSVTVFMEMNRELTDFPGNTSLQDDLITSSALFVAVNVTSTIVCPLNYM